MWAVAQTSASSTDATVIIWGGVLTLIGVIVTAVFSYLSHKNAKEANAAVNHRKPGQDRLFDMVADTRDKVIEIDEWKKRWDDMPDEIGTADKLVTQFKVIEDRIDTSSEMISKRLSRMDNENAVAHGKLGERLDTVESKIDGHVQWEMEQKWSTIEAIIKDKETP